MNELEETTPGPFFAGLVAPLRRRPGEPLADDERREMMSRHLRSSRVHVMRDDDDEEPPPKRVVRAPAEPKAGPRLLPLEPGQKRRRREKIVAPAPSTPGDRLDAAQVKRRAEEARELGYGAALRVLKRGRDGEDVGLEELERAQAVVDRVRQAAGGEAACPP